jgi:hypothetical protein
LTENPYQRPERGPRLGPTCAICVAEAEKTATLKEEFLRQHPAAFYVDFDDFLCMRMEVKALRYIGGFGEISRGQPGHLYPPGGGGGGGRLFCIDNTNEIYRGA